MDKNPDDKKNLWIAIAFVITAVFMGGLTVFLRSMSLDFVLGFSTGVAITVGLAAILIKDFRNLS